MKRIVIPDWLYQKIAKEHKAPRVWSGHVDCVFGESEKAYHVMMGAVNHTVFAWLPKSQCTWIEAEHENDQTAVVDNYEQALEYRNYLRSCYC